MMKGNLENQIGEGSLVRGWWRAAGAEAQRQVQHAWVEMQTRPDGSRGSGLPKSRREIWAKILSRDCV